MRKNQQFATSRTGGESPIARVYIRVSKIMGRGEGTGHELLSPETQMEAGRMLAKINGWVLDEEASLANTDLDESAFRQTWDKRKGLVAHLEDARKGKFQVLVAYKLGRLARNAREGLILCDLFQQAGVGVYTQVEGIDPKTVVGRMQRTLMFGIAEMQSENISEDVTANFATRVRSGKTHGRPPAWVRKDPQTGALSLDPIGAASLRRLVELRMIPTSYSHTARILNAEGHYRPLEQHAENRGDARASWNAAAVYKSLAKHRRFLMRGHFEYLRDLDEDDPRRVQLLNVWPALLEPEIADKLDATEARLHEEPLQSPLPPGGNFPSQTSRSSERVPGAGASEMPRDARSVVPRKYILSGILYCAACGHRMRAATRSYRNGHANMRYYWCQNASAQPERHPIRKDGGLGASFDADMVEWAVLRIVEAAIRTMRDAAAASAIAANPPDVGPRKTNLKRGPANTSATSAGSAPVLDPAAIGRAITKLFDLHEAEIITTADFENRYTVLKARQAQANAALAESIAPSVVEQAPIVLASLAGPSNASDQPNLDAGAEASAEVRALGNGRKAVRPPVPSDEAVAAANLFLRNLISRIDVPIAVGGRTQRDELTEKRKAKTQAAYSNPLRYVRVHFREGLLPAASAISELRQMKWKRSIPEVVFEALSGSHAIEEGVARID